MKKQLFVISLLLLASLLCAQDKSLLVLGDLHYDHISHHDPENLKKLTESMQRQSRQYPQYFADNWSDYQIYIRKLISGAAPTVRALVQLGDFTQGACGSLELARQMDRAVIDTIEKTALELPLLLVKGNHDQLGAGQAQAFDEILSPYIKRWAGVGEMEAGQYVYRDGDIQVVVLDTWDKMADPVEFARKALASSDARYKFVAMHMPVIPVSPNGWCIYADNLKKREEFKKILAQNRVIVLCGHVHLSVLAEMETEWGPIVQVTACSVMDGRPRSPFKIYTEYDVLKISTAAPAVLDLIEKEAPKVTNYRRVDANGSFLISMEADGKVTASFYPNFNEEAAFSAILREK